VPHLGGIKRPPVLNRRAEAFERQSSIPDRFLKMRRGGDYHTVIAACEFGAYGKEMQNVSGRSVCNDEECAHIRLNGSK
jgi:hypothetical protein